MMLRAHYDLMHSNLNFRVLFLALSSNQWKAYALPSTVSITLRAVINSGTAILYTRDLERKLRPYPHFLIVPDHHSTKCQLLTKQRCSSSCSQLVHSSESFQPKPKGLHQDGPAVFSDQSPDLMMVPLIA